MGWTRSLTLATTVALLAGAAALPAATASEDSAIAARATPATVSVLHAVPAGLGVGVVDVYAGRSLLVDDLSPGTLETVRVPAGSYDLTVLPNGRVPGTSTPLLSAPQTRIPAGRNLTVTANLTSAGRPVLTVFTNDTTTVGNGMGRLTVRQVAAAGPVDVRSGGSVLMSGLRNPRQQNVGLYAGKYAITFVEAGTRRAILGPTSVTISNSPGTQDMGTNTIVYLWGSADAGSLQTFVQNVRIDIR